MTSSLTCDIALLLLTIERLEVSFPERKLAIERELWGAIVEERKIDGADDSMDGASDSVKDARDRFIDRGRVGGD